MDWQQTWSRNYRGSIGMIGHDPSYYSLNNDITRAPYRYTGTTLPRQMSVASVARDYRKELTNLRYGSSPTHLLPAIEEEFSGLGHPRVRHLGLAPEVANMVEAYLPTRRHFNTTRRDAMAIHREDAQYPNRVAGTLILRPTDIFYDDNWIGSGSDTEEIDRGNRKRRRLVMTHRPARTLGDQI